MSVDGSSHVMNNLVSSHHDPLVHNEAEGVFRFYTGIYSVEYWGSKSWIRLFMNFFKHIEQQDHFSNHVSDQIQFTTDQGETQSKFT